MSATFSPAKLTGNLADGRAAGSRWINRLTAVPSVAIPIRTNAVSQTFSCPNSPARSASLPPTPIPMTTAESVARLKIPFPLLISFSPSSSGIVPTFEGAKRALWAPIRNTADISRNRLWHNNATTPNAMMMISATLQEIITCRFENRSASQPAGDANRMYGSTKQTVPNIRIWP